MIAYDLGLVTLCETKIDDDALARLKGCSSLGTLDLRSTSVSDSGLRHLLALPRLESLTVLNTRVTEEGAMRFAEAAPKVRLTYTMQYRPRAKGVRDDGRPRPKSPQ